MMACAATTNATLSGVRASARGPVRARRTAATPVIATRAGKSATLGGIAQSRVPTIAAAAVVSSAAPAPRRSVVPAAGGGGPVVADTVPEDVRFDMTPEGEKKRWSMIFALFCAFVLCNLDKVNMSVAIVPMAQSFGWTSIEKGLVQSAFFWGYAFTQIPGGYLASKYGGKFVLFAGVMLWSFGTLIAPACAHFSFTALLVSRFLVGLGEGVAPSAATGVLAKGVPGSQRSAAVTATFGGLDVGSLSGLIVAPPIILFLGGWAAVFYLFGALGFIWGAWWALCYMRDKSTDARDTPEEVAAKAAAPEKAEDPIPWGAFFKNKSFWALMAAHFTWNYFSYGLLAWLPSFLSSALNVSLSKSSFLSILPYLATVGMTLIVAPTAAKLEAGGMTRTNVRKLSQTLCFTGGAVCLSAVAFVVNSTPPEAVTQTTVITIMTLLSIGFGLGAWVRTGLFCGHQDISPKYASIMLGTTNTLAAVASTLSTFFTGYFFSITGGNWALSLFLPIAFFQVVSTLIFMMWDSTPVDFDAIQAEGKLKAA